MYFNSSQDIATFQGSAIVNSLGIGEFIHEPGALFSTILAASKDTDALMNEVVGKGKGLSFGSVFSTPSHGLPCQRIIHVITPFRAMDKHYAQITKCYEDILKLTINEGLKSISIPLIGTGANGYSPDKVAGIARSICYQFSQEHPEIDIYFNVYSIEHPDPVAEEKEKRLAKIVRPVFAPVIDACGAPRVKSINGAERERGVPKIKYQAEPVDPFVKRIGLEFEDSFATMVRKCVFYKTKGTNKKKEEVLEKVWCDINSEVSFFKDASQALSDTVEQITNRPLEEVGVYPDTKGLKYPHAPQYEWKRNKNPKGRGYVWQRPNKAEMLLSCIALHLNEEEALEVYAAYGHSLSPIDRYDYAFRECIKLLGHPNSWSKVLKAYTFSTSESIYDYREERVKKYVDRPEDWA